MLLALAVLVTGFNVAGYIPRHAYAEAVAKPPNTGRQWSYIAGTLLSTTATTLQLATQSSTDLGPAATVMIMNDDAAGGDDIWYSFDTTTIAAAPTAGSTGSKIYTIKPQEKLSYDIMATSLTLRSATGSGSTGLCRVHVTYPK